MPMTRPPRFATILLGLVAMALIGVPPGVAAVRLPPANGQFDYQIGGAYPPQSPVAIVDRDRFDPPVTGLSSRDPARHPNSE